MNKTYIILINLFQPTMPSACIKIKRGVFCVFKEESLKEWVV